MTAGIDDVARVAGVSTATVSRALRGLPNVAESTRVRVLAVAGELGYVASPSAASLASGRTRTIGLLTPWVTHWFFSHVIEGAERALRAEGFDALLYTFEVRRRTPRPRFDPGVLRRRVDGVLVVGLPLDPGEIAALEALGYPVVCIGPGAATFPTVGVDDVAIAREATRHLLDLGHTCIAHVTGEPDDRSVWSPVQRRGRGWREEMAAAGLPSGGRLEAHGGFDVAGGRATGRALLAAHPEVTAVFAASDEMALGVILAARDLGRRVPADLSVVGVDGHDMGGLLGLTTFAQDVLEQGAAAATMVLELITGTPVPLSTTYPARLVDRGSTGPVRSAVPASPVTES